MRSEILERTPFNCPLMSSICFDLTFYKLKRPSLRKVIFPAPPNYTKPKFAVSSAPPAPKSRPNRVQSSRAHYGEVTSLLDLLIQNGMIIDGTGNPGYYGSVGVEGDRLTVFRGSVDGVEASRAIDARRMVICPGFIDMHAHSGLVLLSEPMHEPKVRQGVTTELIGVDGNSYAPFRSQRDFRLFVEMNSGLDGRPPLPGSWSTVEQYLDMFDRRAAVNIAYILGNSPLRIDAIGWESTPATERDVANMKAMIREADAGGRARHVHRLGLSARRVRQHGRAGRAVRAGRRAWRHLPYPRQIQVRRQVPRPVQRGDRDRRAQRRSRPHHPLLPEVACARRRAAAARAGPKTPPKPARTSPSTATHTALAAPESSSCSQTGSTRAAPSASSALWRTRTRARG